MDKQIILNEIYYAYTVEILSLLLNKGLISIQDAKKVDALNAKKLGISHVSI